MSRSNGSQPPSADRAPQAGGYDVNPDPRAWTAPQNANQQTTAPQYQAHTQPFQPAQQRRPAAAQSADQGYAPAAPAGYTDPYAQQNGYYQSPAQSQTYTAQTTAGRAAAQTNPAASYAPQFDPYVPAQAYQPVQQPAAAKPATPYPDLRGTAYEHPVYEQWATAQPQQADTRGYDLASYGAHDQQQAYGQQTPQAYAAQTGRAQTDAEWGHQPSGYAQQPAFDPYAGQQPQNEQPDYGLGNAHADQQAGAGYEAHDTGEGMEDDAPRSRRGLLIAATLAGAIFVGGGLTYAYNSLLGNPGGPPPLVKSAEGPSKVKPAEPGGKQFAHADSKVLGRLTENGSSSDVDASGSRKVATLVVKPDGTIEPPALTEPAAAAPDAPSSSIQPVASVPGLSVVNVGGTALAPAPPAPAPPAPAAPAPAQQAAAQKPVVVNAPAAAPPKSPVAVSQAAPAAANSLVETAAVDSGAVASAAPAAKKAAPAVKKVAAAPAVSAPAAAATGAGYMAVIASVPASAKSRLDALAQWADMQQKYGTVLQSKTMDVQEANLGEKGTYHRLLVGPPSSKDSANSVCSQLKAAGHTDCWVMAY